MKRIVTMLSVLLLTVVMGTACGEETGGSEDDRLMVVATTGQIHDALRNIGGAAIELHGLLGPGIDPHLYVPTEGNVQLFSDADMIVYNGLNLEAQMVRVLGQMADRGAIVVALGEALPEERLLRQPAGTVDPHVWNDPALWSIGVNAILEALVDADPDNAALYRANAETYLAEVAAADAYVAEQVARIAPDKRILITAHDAFGYFANAYGMKVYGIQGISTESEASTADLQNLAEIIVTNQVPAVFVETSVSPRTIEALQAAVANQGFDVAIGGQLFSDALGEAGHPAETYIGMLRHNSQTIADALADS